MSRLGLPGLLGLACWSGVVCPAWPSAHAEGADAPPPPLEAAPAPAATDLEALKTAAQRGNPAAQFSLGLAYYQGQGLPRDAALAVQWFRKAAEQGLPEAEFNMGTCYAQGLGVAQDLEQSARWFRRVAERGVADAQNRLASCYLLGLGIPKDLDEGIRWARRAAEQGNPEAQGNLGVAYLKGEGVVPDLVEALKWLTLAANHGNVKAGSDRANMLKQFNLSPTQLAEAEARAAEFVPKPELVQSRANPPVAPPLQPEAAPPPTGAPGPAAPIEDPQLATWRAAAERGEAWAQFNLGCAYTEGRGVPRDEKVAADWFRKAAEQGVAAAQSNLGIFYEQGRGVPQNFVASVRWLQRAAEQGFAEAQASLAMRFLLGQGVPKDAAQGVEWSRRAAEQGHPRGQGNLGLAYRNGEGVKRDLVEAIKWLTLAANHGFTKASADLACLLQELKPTPAQVDEGRRRAAEFVPRPTPVTLSPVIPPVWRARAGSGFFITDDGFLLTAFHVVAQAAELRVKVGQRTLPAKLVRADPANDLAVLKVEGHVRALPLVASSQVKLGQSVFTIGFPNPDWQGLEPKLTRGEISGLAGVFDDPRHFQTSVPMQGGNSGGPLMDERGNVVGILVGQANDSILLRTTGMLPQNVNYALKSAYALALTQDLPELAGRLKSPRTSALPFEDVVQQAESAVALVLTH